ncbi:hypothetical protein N7509_007092 [Penicillium cosmopolitanum]|uniref:Azaphilone pigments biosynthesis cluster protein L N-terminal domain-containing protein n=1 Tax=Penicillium cosmopolitanum TaxID=1131564 RepID=A0A9W9VY74_9EURO|nr:uncharacterized protein N7509_007092 [Penicillium cosmopolitanum]KAJ5391602.1 hypothetical protein N7509_007092 [Penicillium cosmopolitanum]
MADPLSLVSGIAGVVIPALHGMRLLLRDLQDIKDAPKNVQDLKNELSLVDGALSSLQDIEPEDLDSLGPSVGDNIKSTVKVCSTACDKFRADLQRWTRHSQDKKLSWRDRSTIGFWKQDDIKSIQGKLHNCQVNITSVVSTATLSFHHVKITQEIRKTLSLKEDELKAVTQSTVRQRGQVELQLESLSIQDPKPEETAKNLQEEQRYLEESQKLLGELLAKIQEAAKPQATPVVNVTFGSQNSGLQIATNNAPMSGFVFGGRGE